MEPPVVTSGAFPLRPLPSCAVEYQGCRGQTENVELMSVEPEAPCAKNVVVIRRLAVANAVDVNVRPACAVIDRRENVSLVNDRNVDDASIARRRQRIGRIGILRIVQRAGSKKIAPVERLVPN